MRLAGARALAARTLAVAVRIGPAALWLIAGCSPSHEAADRAVAEQCRSLDSARVAIGDLVVDTPVMDRADGNALVDPVEPAAWLTVPSSVYTKRKTAMFQCQKRSHEPARVRNVSVKIEAGRLFPNSPFYRTIELIALPPDVIGRDVDITRIPGADLVHARLVGTRLTGGYGLVPVLTYRFQAARAGPVFDVECTLDGPGDRPPRSWTHCDAVFRYRRLRLVIGFYTADGRAADESGRDIAEAVKFLDRLVSPKRAP